MEGNAFLLREDELDIVFQCFILNDFCIPCFVLVLYVRAFTINLSAF